MGKVKRKVQKLIPKEIKPFVAPLAAMYLGPMAAGALGTGVAGSAAGRFFTNALVNAAAQKAVNNDIDPLSAAFSGAAGAAGAGYGKVGGDAVGLGSIKVDPNLEFAKDFAAATGESSGLSAGQNLQLLGQQAAQKSSQYLNPNSATGTAKLIAAQEAIPGAQRLKQINEDELAKYNAQLLEQGIGNKTARRKGIYDIYAGIQDDNDERVYSDEYINSMLDQYSYAKGGKVDKPVVPADELAKILEEFMKQQDKQEEIRRQNKADGGRVGLEAGGDPEKAALVQEVKRLRDELDDKKTTKGVQSGMEYATKGFEQALGGPLGGAVAKPMRIIPGFARGGITDIDVNETITETENEPEGMALNTDLLREYRSYKMEQEELGMPVIPFREWFGMTYGASRAGVAEGGIMNASRIDTDDVAQSLFQEYLDMGMTPEQAASAVRDYLDSSTMGLKDGGNVSMTDDDSGVIYHDEKGKPISKSKAMELFNKQAEEEYSKRDKKAKGGLLGLKMGGVPAELDYRGGGMIQVGSKEKADDVPARLSKNEFVMTADAVKGAGGGDPRRGAERMYQMMDQFEAKV